MNDFDPSKIRKCELITVNGTHMVQFIATGDKHQMMKQDDVSIQMIKLPEQGKDYRYGDPVMPMEAFDILNHDAHPSHASISKQLRDRMNGK